MNTAHHVVLRTALLALALSLVACERGSKAPTASAAGETDLVRTTTLATGARLYAANCAECHGPQAQGHPDWQNAASGGFVAAPPLDASGPLMQRSHAALVATVQKGVQRTGVPVMPAWQGRLSDAEIDAIFAWVFSQWPSDAYAAWRSANAPPATASAHPQ